MTNKLLPSAGTETTPVAAVRESSSPLALLKKVFHTLEAIGRAINRVVGRILVFLVYFLAVGPLALITRLAGKSLLEPVSAPPSGSLWLKRSPSGNEGLVQARRQF